MSDLRELLEKKIGIGAFQGSSAHALIDDDENPIDARGQAPTEAELDLPYVAPGREALLPWGVVYQADWHAYADGMARHGRLTARALAEAGVPVCLQSISSGRISIDADIHHEVRAEVGYLHAITFDKVAIAIRQAVLHSPEFLRGLIIPNSGRLGSLDDELEIYRSTIVYTSLERDRVSPELAMILGRVGEVWVPCQANKRALVGSGIAEHKVAVVPCPYEPASAVASIGAPRGPDKVPDGRRFYTIGKWEKRKDQARLLRCFLLAFSASERVSLCIKTHGWGTWKNYPSLEAIEAECARNEAIRKNGWNDKTLARSVRIIMDKVSADELVELHRKNNIYVSASHGEAWDIPAFEAKAAGNRLVHVGYGGSEDYADEHDERVGFTMSVADSEYRWESDAQWAEYSDEALIEALRRAKPPAERVHPPSFNRRFSMHAVGELMKARIERFVGKSALDKAGSYG